MNGQFGRWDWVANSVLFALYHLHVPWVVPQALLDTFILAYPSKRYRSALVGIIVHSAQSGVFIGHAGCGVQVRSRSTSTSTLVMTSDGIPADAIHHSEPEHRSDGPRVDRLRRRETSVRRSRLRPRGNRESRRKPGCR